MKSVSTLALGLALAVGGVIASSPAVAQKKDAAPKQNFSPKIAQNHKAVNDAITAKDWEKAKAGIAVSEPQIKTDDDKMLVGNYYVQVGQGTQDKAMLSKGIDLLLVSGKIDPAQQSKLYMAQAKIAYEAKDNDKAIAAANQAMTLNTDDPDVVPVLTQSYLNKGQQLQALQAFNAAIDSNAKAGRPVPRDWYQRGFAIAYQAKPNTPGYAEIKALGNQINMKWVKAEPTGATWHDVVLAHMEGHPGDSEQSNDARRLLMQTGGLKTPADYLEYAEAVYQKAPGEAKMVIDDGVKKGAFTLASNKNAAEINGIVAPKVAADKASLPGTEAKAKTAADGKLAVVTADGYLGYGDNAKAAELYKLALTKGGVDANVVNTRLGIALARTGDKAGAKAAFGAVTGARKDLADLWALYVDQPPAA